MRTRAQFERLNLCWGHDPNLGMRTHCQPGKPDWFCVFGWLAGWMQLVGWLAKNGWLVGYKWLVGWLDT